LLKVVFSALDMVAVWVWLLPGPARQAVVDDLGGLAAV
jgi:hypothetical protein